MKPLWLALLLSGSLALAGGGGSRPLIPAFVNLGYDCDDAQGQTDGCRLRIPLPAVTGLGVGEWRVVPGHDALSVVYRAPAGTREVALCCGLQLPLSPVPGTDLWGVSARVKDVQHAVLSLAVIRNGVFPKAMTTWRGPLAPAPISTLTPLTLRGQVQTFALNSGDPVMGSRRVTVYTPPDWTPAESLPAIYLADGAAVGLALTLEPQILAGTVPRVILVGIESAPGSMGGSTYDPTKDRRAMEYLDGYPGGQAAFEAHELFVLGAVLLTVEDRYHVLATPAGRVVGGFSNGASWAISMGARHPDVFGGVIAMSPAWQLPEPASALGERVFVSGGTLEAPFLSTARQLAAAVRAHGRAVQLVTRVGGHDTLIWQEVFPRAVSFVLQGR